MRSLFKLVLLVPLFTALAVGQLPFILLLGVVITKH